ncbi:MAG: protein kinase [Deltaproteobacteria bacterium]
MQTPDSAELRRLLRDTHGLDPDSTTLDLRETIRPVLASDEDAGAATILIDPTDPATGTQPLPPEAGFEVSEELGRGGMNIVYRALQKDLQREVALKRIRPERERDAPARSDFLREAQITGHLEHPNILPVHGLSVGPKGEISLAMKLMGGHTWAEMLHPKTRAQRQAAEHTSTVDHLRILLAICNAVSFAHSRGVIHRDIKPENVMLGAFGEVVLMDWGIALRKDADGIIPQGEPIRLAGTPAYMAPEMINPGGRRIGTATDIYLLGAVLFEILQGSPPHAAPNLFQALALATSSTPPRMRDELPEELRLLCHRAMAHQPEDRIESALAFRRSIEEHLAHRESRALSDRASEMLADCQRDSAVEDDASPERRTTVYGDLARAIAGFEQARLLWPENTQAQSGETDTRYALAEIALAAGDLVMARSAAANLPEGRGRELGAAVDKAVEARRAARYSARRISAGLILFQLVVAAVLGFFSWQELDEFYLDETALRLADVNPAIVAALRQTDSLSPDVIDPLIDGIAMSAEMRVTVIAPDGTVLGDSEALPSAMENHAGRAEILDALQLGHGLAVRASPTLGGRMVYYALPMYDSEGHTLAIVRTALPWSAVHESLLDFLAPLAAALAIAVFLGCLATLLAWRRLDRQVAQL